MKTLIEEDLPMQIDCTQWHPTLSNTLAIGAYQLDAGNSDVRIGRVYFLKLTKEIPGGFQIVLEKETLGGVLDLKFLPSTLHPSSSSSTSLHHTPLAIGTSTGLHIYSFQATPTYQLTLISSINTGTAMVLYLQWIDEGRIIFSDSEGNINLVEKGGGGKWLLGKKKKLHDALSWICHYSEGQDVVYCGCDDGKFTAFGLGAIMQEGGHMVKQFEVGVTSISTHQSLVAIGTYADILSLHELSSTTPKPHLTPKTSINLQGAVWRSLFLPSLHSNQDDKWVIATACARKGVKLLEYDAVGGKLRVVFENLKYEGALCYGLDVRVDWLNSCYVIASGYFDNHVVEVFEVSL